MQRQAWSSLAIQQTFTRKRRLGWILLWSVLLLFCVLDFMLGIYKLMTPPLGNWALYVNLARVVVYPYWASRFVPALLWELIGKESVESSDTGITLTRCIGSWKRQWHFTWAELRTLERAAPLPSGKQADLPWTLERGLFQLRHQGTHVRFGIRLEHNTVLSFLEEVQSLVRQQGY